MIYIYIPKINVNTHEPKIYAVLDVYRNLLSFGAMFDGNSNINILHYTLKFLKLILMFLGLDIHVPKIKTLQIYVPIPKEKKKKKLPSL